MIIFGAWILLVTSSIICEKVQIFEEPKNGTEIEVLTKYLKNYIVSVATSYKIFDGNRLLNCLHIDPETHVVTVKNRIDRESLCPNQINCDIILRFFISPSYVSKSLNVEILDINDNAPSWPQQSKVVSFTEFEGNKIESRTIHIDKAFDPDVNENSQIDYFLKDRNGKTDNSVWKVKYDSSTSRRIELMPIKVIDREQVDVYELILIAVDNGSPKKTGSLELTIQILDKNDNGPIFDRVKYYANKLSENANIGFVALTVSAKDADFLANGKITYRIEDQKASEYFNIGHNGNIMVRKSINYDAGVKSFQFSVLAVDGAPEEYRKTGECEVVIMVIDENDEKPEIIVHVTKRDPLTNEPAIIENEVISNSVLAHIEVKDPDFEGRDIVSCSLTNNDKMRLEQASPSDKEFQILAIANFDREEKSMEKVDILCKDQAYNTASKSIVFQILDRNDNSPKFTRVFHFRVLENATSPNMFVGEVMAVDKDAERNSKIEFQIIGNEEHFFQIDSSGKMYTKQVLDREETEKFNVTILAKDGGDPPKTGTGLVTIEVVDINDWKPEFSLSLYEFSISENAGIGTTVGTVTAIDRDLPANTKMKYRIVSDRFSKDSYFPYSSLLPFKMIRYDRGEIVTKYPLDREKQSHYLLTVVAIDNGDPKSFTSTTTVKINIIDVNDNFPTFKTSNKTVFSIQTTESVGYEIGTVEAVDLDYGENSEIVYQIEDGNQYGYFSFNTQNKKLILNSVLSKQGDHKLVISACDKGKPPKCSNPLWITIKVVKQHIPKLNDPPSSDTFSDSKTYVFIISVLVILLLIIIILIICAIVFRNRICTQLNQNGNHTPGDTNTLETTKRKIHMENEIQRNTTMHSLTCADPLMMSQQRNINNQHPIYAHSRERQISSDYQSIEERSPSYKQTGQFAWDSDSMLQIPINEQPDQFLYVQNRSAGGKEYYYPEQQHSQYRFAPIVPYDFQGMPSPSYVIRNNQIPKEPQFHQDTFPRNMPHKLYSSLLNVQTINSQPEPTYVYKSLRKGKNNASFV